MTNFQNKPIKEMTITLTKIINYCPKFLMINNDILPYGLILADDIDIFSGKKKKKNSYF